MLKARDMVDLVASQFVLKRKGQIRLKVSNLLNKPFILYQDLNANGKLDKPYVTVKNSFNNGTGQGNYVSGIDNTVAYTQPQRTFSFSFAYTF